MRLKELLNDLNIIETNADMEMEISGIGSDSKMMRPGEIFVAITGFERDGHDFIGDAKEHGASCVICEKDIDSDVPYIKVDDTRKAMACVSATWFGYPANKLKLIGVTGTSGKTSVTHIIKHIIESCTGSKTGLIGTIENLIGERKLEAKLTTPDAFELHSTLDKMAFEGCKYAVMEVSSHALCLHRVYGIHFEAGVFTNLSPEHLDFHESMEDYSKAKSMLFENCTGAVINADDEYSGLMIDKSGGKVLTYSCRDEFSNLYADAIKLFPDKTEFDAHYLGETVSMSINVPGMFTVYNTLSAIGVGIELGFELEEIKKALATCRGIKGRAEVLVTGRDYTVMIDYAHKPDALENIIKTARLITTGKIHTLFGCGGDRDKAKRPIMGRIAVQLSDFVIVTSDNPRTEKPDLIIDDILSGIENVFDERTSGRLKVIENRRDAIFEAMDALNPGDILIIAGKGHESYQIIGYEKTHFDDREIVEEYLKRERENKRRRHTQIEGLD